MTVVWIVLIFGFLVLTHEWGHFIAARRHGVEVEEFGFGFPPKLLGFKRGGTLYSLNLLPLGGFVRLKGEASADNSPRSFGAAGFRTQAKILLAGVGMNFLTAYVVILALCLTGLPPFVGDEIKYGHPSYSQPKQLMVIDVQKDSPGWNAGLRDGDLVLSGNNQSFTVESQLQTFTKTHAGQTVSLMVKHRGKLETLKVKLRPPSSTNGFLGVVPLQVYQLRWSPLNSVWVAAWFTLRLVWLVLAGLGGLIYHLPQLVTGLFQSGVPQAAEATSGPVGIFFILRTITALGLAYVGLFVANIAVALAVFNALPIPALDGGRLALLASQRLSRRSLSQRVETAIHVAGFVFLIALFVLITVYDFRKFL